MGGKLYYITCIHLMISLFTSMKVQASIDDVRLAGVGVKANSNFGRVEILHDGVWGTICDDNWDINDANVVCRMLGFSKASQAIRLAFFGSGETILLDEVSCSGSETSLNECGHAGLGKHDCTKREDASVVCESANTTLLGVRLVGGDKFSGRVEINYEGLWGTICDGRWSLSDARVVCRMLGFNDALAAHSGAHFGQGSGYIILDKLDCWGGESSLADCDHGGWFRSLCNHRRDASVVCEMPDGTSNPVTGLRLMDGGSYYGRVEIRYQGKWRTICDNSWDLNDARVICRMLGFPNAIAAPDSSHFGEGSANVGLGNVACLGNETSIADCNHDGWLGSKCYHREVASVVCQQANLSHPGIRLAGGDSTYGRVEIYYKESWGTICHYDWDMNDANVVCRMLGLGYALAAPRRAHFGSGTGDILLDEVACTGSEESIFECKHDGWNDNSCSHGFEASVVCKQTNGTGIRLADGGASYGRVEIYYKGSWGTICDDSWSIGDAKVVCRMLGFEGAIAAPKAAFYGRGTGDVLLDELKCSGNEDSIFDCPLDGWDDNYCSHRKDASVVCQVDSTMTKPEIRLVDGGVSYGRVELKYPGFSGTICDESWDIRDAHVICRMLGYSGATAAPGNARYGQGKERILMEEINCSGGETSILDCGVGEWGRRYCRHNQDASVVCDISAASGEKDTGDPVTGVRLAGGGSYYGRVEIQYQEKWRTICDDGWDMNDARVICRMLGFPSALAAPDSAHFGQGLGDILLANVACLGNETSISECSHDGWLLSNCYHNEDASVVCQQANLSHPGIRLAGGGSSYGRVEIYYKDRWGTICDSDWDMNDASVVCRMLGFEYVLRAPRRAHFGRGTGDILLDDVACRGSEESIFDCKHGGWDDNYCWHGSDASVVCQPKNGIEIRLAGGDSTYGRVEMYYKESWGTICDSDWDVNDAKVVCRMLGFEYALAAPRRAHFGRGTGDILLDEMACTGSEESIFECKRDGWNDNYCWHGRDASVVCQQTNGTGIRLADGGASYGRVEIYYKGAWGTICDDGWSLEDAKVVCRMLGFEDAIAAPAGAYYGKGAGEVLLDDVECSGNEDSIFNCPHDGWDKSYCSHRKDASVICQVETLIEPEVRLVGGGASYGRVELSYPGLTGTICDDDWDIEDAHVICHMLGYSSATAAHGKARYGQGEGEILMKSVDCVGNEKSILDCKIGVWNAFYCDHGEDSSVECLP